MAPAQPTILLPCTRTGQAERMLDYALPMAQAFGAALSFLWMGGVDEGQTFRDEVLKAAGEDTGQLDFQQTTNWWQHPLTYGSPSRPFEVLFMLFQQLPQGRFPHWANLRFILRTRRLRLPFMVLPPDRCPNWRPHKLWVPVGYNRSDKEAALWASYWAKTGTKVHLLVASEKEKWAAHACRNNARFFLQLFKKLQLPIQTEDAACNSRHLQQYALQKTVQNNHSLLLITTTRVYGIEHYFGGPSELRTIQHTSHQGVFCVNPRRDNYVLCGDKLP